MRPSPARGCSKERKVGELGGRRMMRVWRRLDLWAARVNPGLVVVAAVLALVDGSIVLGKQAARPLPAAPAALVAEASARRPESAPPGAKVAEARPPARLIYTRP
jgi:hypothetical protein